MKIGNVKDFTKEVNEIFINDEKYFLVKKKSGYFLFDSICPHQGANLFFNNDTNTICCPVHGWKFDITSGCAINVKSKSLYEKEIEVTENGDILLHNNVQEKIVDKVIIEKKFRNLRYIYMHMLL